MDLGGRSSIHNNCFAAKSNIHFSLLTLLYFPAALGTGGHPHLQLWLPCFRDSTLLASLPTLWLFPLNLGYRFLALVRSLSNLSFKYWCSYT